MCRVPSPLTRRVVLRGGLTAATGVAVGAALAGCDRGPSAEQITAAALLPLADAALADQVAAQSLAPRAPAYTRALGVVAEQRGAHAQALREEITRLDQETANRIVAPSAAPIPPPTTVAELRGRLTRSARLAGDAGSSLSGYSAGLAGSVSAAVTSMVEVQLG
ncbi:hypothetical protein AAFP35_09400 [Gordonia sp. CPCC 206044]|uniref:hypothetical protein n=1 Tax=Gordonia sp. CPCC 206044 TaxID=3140793 RepID=UPI003AF39FF3